MLLHVSLSITDLVSGRDDSMDESQLAKETANADGRRGDSYYQSVVARVWLQATLLTLEDCCLCLEDEVKGIMKGTFFQLLFWCKRRTNEF